MPTSRSSESVGHGRLAPVDGSASSETIARILDSARFIEAHLESRVGVADMAEAACYSLFHYCRSFNRLTRMSPYDYFIRRRLTVAADLDSLDSPAVPLFAAGRSRTGAIGGTEWFGVHYFASRLTAFAGVESRDAVSCPNDHPFRIDLPAGDYLAVDCIDLDGEIASLFGLTFSTFYPATRNPGLPATVFAVRSSDRLRILVPAPSRSGESSTP